MARIIFVQNIWVDLAGPMWISSYVKSKGHESRIIIEPDTRKIIDEVKNFSPDVVGFYCITGAHRWTLNVSASIKERFKNILTVFGGPHPTFYPPVLEKPQVDIICRGEGELATLELLDAIDGRKEIKKILNLSTKEDGRIIANNTRPLVGDLNTLPFPDRSHYDRYTYFRKSTMAFFIASRGCPYKCSFCFNRAASTLQEGKYVRYRSPENVVNEIEEYRGTRPLERVHFHDDTFILNTSWLFKFLELYRKRINLPFHCNLRANLVTEEIVRELKMSSCFAVSFGIEHGNELIRQNVLKKNITNHQITNTADLLRKYGIEFKTFNMVGLPGETLEEAYETVTLNQKIKSTYPWCSIFTPYPGTEAGDFAIRNGFVEDGFNLDSIPEFYLKRSVIKQDNIRQLVNLQKFFLIAARFPRLFPLIKILIKLPLTFIYDAIFSVIYLYNYVFKLYRMKTGEMIRFNLQLIKSVKIFKKSGGA
ncbi:MAG: B12-binding domain-containing radical SAM protein [Elusimicrobia bacterium]|nr:B12-binding domain-containing radical SAM protein [Elusimicrobiota bacterium]